MIATLMELSLERVLGGSFLEEPRTLRVEIQMVNRLREVLGRSLWGFGGLTWVVTSLMHVAPDVRRG